MEGNKLPFESPFTNITVNPDGTVNRPPIPRSPANPDPNGASPVLSKDVVLDPNKKTWIRLYIPKIATANKLPLILYYHGGGFVFCNADTCFYDAFCQGLAMNVNAMVISLDYRLAPEHRLPAAIEDAMDGFHWILQNKDVDEWVNNYADLNNLFLFGSSAGANIAYHAPHYKKTGLIFGDRLIFGNENKVLENEMSRNKVLKVRGLILHQPFFSGKKRTGSNKKFANDWLLPLYGIDKLFDLSLPEGVDYDHEYCNPLLVNINGESSKIVDEMKRMGWRVLVTGCFNDPLVDAGMEFAKMLEVKGVKTVKFFSDGYHSVEIFEPSKSGPLYDVIKKFICDG